MGRTSDLLRTDRFRSQAKQHATGRANSTFGETILPLHRSQTDHGRTHAGELNGGRDAGRGTPTVRPAASGTQPNGARSGASGGGEHDGLPEASARNDTDDAICKATPPPAPPPHKSEDEGAGNASLGREGGDATTVQRPPVSQRMKASARRFVLHSKNAIFHSWINVLLAFVPAGIVAEALHLNPAIIFALNAVAIVPLAGLLSHATEIVANQMGNTLGALLNVSFGNAVELIIFIIALVKNEIQIVQASLLGSILANLLLILGMCFLFGGLIFREQIYNNTVTQMSACLVSLSVMSLLLPTAFHASFNNANTAQADMAVLRVSRGTSVVLLAVYFLYLLFQLKSHAYMYESTPQAIIDEESHPGVLADIMNSSSSSEDGISTDSTDSDTSGSGSIIQTGKKIRKKMFRRRRRKSSASTTSATLSSGVPSALSSPSTTERQGSYWEYQVNLHKAYSQETSDPTLGAIASGDEADTDNRDGSRNDMPRIRDFGPGAAKALELDNDDQDDKSAGQKRHRRKRHKKHYRKRHHRDHDTENEKVTDVEDRKDGDSHDTHPKVEFSDDIEMVGSLQDAPAEQTPGKLPFNMRQLSRAAYRPALNKMLSNNVFTTPAPQPEPIRRPIALDRVRSETGALRRASSLPEMNRQAHTFPLPTPAFNYRDPLPPFRHQRQELRQIATLDPDNAEQEPSQLDMSRTAAIGLLLISTALVAVCAEFMVDAIPGMIDSSPISEAFVGLIILPIVGNAAEHVTAVTVAMKNKMDLAIGVAVGSSIQIALFVTPIVVLLGWILNTDMSLYFNLFETVSLFVTAFVVNFLVLDGRSNYLEGSLLIAAYTIIAVGAYFYPASGAQSAVGGGASGAG